MLDLLFLRAADVASIIGALVVTTQYETSECEMRDEEHVCSIEM
jgi:hypothetical protein